jgi:arylsulfatase A-like enzyme
MRKIPHLAQGLSRRRFIQGCIGAAAALPAFARPWPSRAAVPPPPGGRSLRRPNLIVLLTDDQRWDSMSCAGNSILQTPNIDALAAGGVRFTNSFVTTAICMSSRASIFTGLYARCHGLLTGMQSLTPRLFANSYPMLLRQAGYRTGFVGKWGLGGALPISRFDYFAGFTGQGYYFERGRTKHLTTLQVDQAVEFLRGCRADQPFCLSVSFKAPHVQDEGRNQPGIYAKYPYDRALEPLYQNANVPPPATVDAVPWPAFFDSTMNRTREGMDFHPEHYQETMRSLYRLLAGVDIAVGRIMQAVRDLGADDNTVVMFTSDHGSFYGEHNFGGKWLMNEESIRSPMIVCDPRLPAELRGATRDQMVLNVDRCPTLLDLAGIPVPPGVQGRSLLPLMQGDRQSPWRTEWFYEHHYLPTLIAPSEGIRTARWKYVRYSDAQPLYEQLFDLSADPREQNNLATQPEHFATLQELRQRWQLWRIALETAPPAGPWVEPAPGPLAASMLSPRPPLVPQLTSHS